MTDREFVESRRGMTPRYEIAQTRDARYAPLAIVEVWPDGQATPLHMFHVSIGACVPSTQDSFEKECDRLNASARPY